MGPPGVCDCFNITSISFADLNITNTFNLDGNFTCAPGSFIDSSCLTVGNCPSFALCELVAASLTLKDGTNPITYLTVGQPGIFTPEVKFGDSSQSMPDFRINKFTVYAETSEVAARTRVDVKATLGSVIIAAGGSIGSVVSIGSSGDITQSSVSDFTINSGATYNVFATGALRLFSSGNWQARGSTANITSDYFSVRKASSYGTGSIWMETFPASSLTLSATLPLIANVDPSIVIAEDIILSEGRSIVNSGVSGFQRIGPYLDIVGGRLKTSGGVNGSLSIENPITNGVMGQGIVFDDLEGIDVKDSWITSSTGDIVLHQNNKFNDMAADIQGSMFASGGTLTVAVLNAGTITATTINGAAGTCCTSDIRMKKEISDMDATKSMELLKKLSPVEFKYVDALLQEDKWVRNTTHYGFIAQELRNVFPNAVHMREKKVGEQVYRDFLSVQKDELIAHMVSAIKHLEAKVAKMEQTLL